ncbi:putative disease resistance RPP13-like protein 1 [Abrus precatorius]|uniref:Disease resistance RPP13-like protein 1 n=1 Tax=Abrus precatorius TaxID=3816 RepID=A0A8B8K410_ABRPR|nr:putative disease resistance RPP13-like protein 1 [Abrus precatorius]
MAGALVGGAFLSGFVNVVFDRLFSPEVASLIRGKKLDHKLVERLKTTLYAIEAVLNDAEDKQINDHAVKKWLHDLRDAVYVADDLLDGLSTEAATHEEASNFFSRVLNLRDRKVVSEIEDITSRLEYLVNFKDTLGLKEIPSENFSWRTVSTSLLEGSGSDIYGRDRDKEGMKKLLLDESSEENVCVIPIVGMGGVGKTTLVQWLYNDENLMGKFDLKAWVCVSEESNVVNITKAVIAAVTRAACDAKDLNLLQLDLKEKLSGKRFLVVLDDVWNIDQHGWNSFKKPFQYGTKGSKILVTTRLEKVASILQTAPPYRLHELSDEYCWTVFAKHARFPESGGDSNLERIGKDIVKRCRGLPLAAETLGCLLQTKHDVADWNTILTSELWEIPVEDSKIIPALKISYYHLPPHLKRCFNIFNCPMLKSLPSHMNTLLPRLNSLSIRDCPNIDSFPEGGLPADLATLQIVNCENLLMCLSLIGVHRGLTDLTIGGANSSLREDLLPQLPSLATLILHKFETMEKMDCNSLLHLTSLQVLRIGYCPKLNNMVGERLPLSLIKLEIDRSPLLAELCEKKHPQIWDRISHISGIHVNGR